MSPKIMEGDGYIVLKDGKPAGDAEVVSIAKNGKRLRCAVNLDAEGVERKVDFEQDGSGDWMCGNLKLAVDGVAK